MIDNPNRNIRKHYNMYQISKYFNGKVYYYGTFHKLEDARKVRDVLEEVNWGLPPLGMKHIQKEGGYWRVRKITNGETVWDAQYKTLEEAIIDGHEDLRKFAKRMGVGVVRMSEKRFKKMDTIIDPFPIWDTVEEKGYNCTDTLDVLVDLLNEQQATIDMQELRLQRLEELLELSENLNKSYREKLIDMNLKMVFDDE